MTVDNFNQSKDRKTKITKRKLNKENLDKIKNDIGNIDWETKIKNQDVNKAFEIFHNKLLEILNLHAPERTVYLKEKQTNKPWISKNLANSIRRSKILYKKLLKQVKRIAKLKYYQSMCNDFKNNTQKLWDMINNLIKKTANKTTILSKLVLNNKEYTSGKDISKILAKHFSTVGKTYANSIKPSTRGLNYYCNKIPLSITSLYFKPTNMVEISNIINKLANKSSYGYDQISNKLIKELRPVISYPLMLVFNKSLEEGMFPELMKQADTIPLYKAKSTEDCNNYRPISLLLTISKILEKLVYSRTVTYLDKHKLFYNSQYGFRKDHSCSDAIMELTSEILKNKEHGMHTASIFIDLSKAFNTLDPNILLLKMNRYGIRGIASNWFENYLKSRKLRVRC